MFDGRVESLGSLQEEIKKRFSLFALMREKKRWQKFIQDLNERLRPLTGSPATLRADQEGTRVCHHSIAREHLLDPLKAHTAGKGVHPHLDGIEEAGSLYLPVDFPEPFRMSRDKAAGDLLVGSSVRLQSELAALNKILRVEQTFAIRKMVDFFVADEKAIAAYEAKMGAAGDFRIKFGYVILRKLADMSVQHRYPLIFSAEDGGTVP